ncbi:hypothetical protein [Alcanivorax sp.]|uniref:hypothetical protein n=1 Tax=Alcanivorax sp. TaxID=1872427 RepID=UPI003A936D39
MKLRKLNSDGCEDFNRFILRSRDGASEATPLHLLENEKTSSETSLEVNLSKINFSSRFEMGEYIVKQFEGHDLQKYLGDIGFWSGLALLWFDQFCPPARDGSRTVSMPYNYVLSHNYKHRYRHAVYITWQLVSRYGRNAQFLLCSEMPKRGELIEQLMARQDILSLEGAMNLASRLYTDPARKKFKKGAASRKGAGCVSRYISWLQQLELTHDLYSATSAELEKLLPSEFQRFLNAA